MMVNASSSSLPNRRSTNLMEDDSDSDERSITQHVSPKKRPFPSQHQRPTDDDDDDPQARKLFPLSDESDSVIVSAISTTRTRRSHHSLPTADSTEEKQETSFAMHNNSNNQTERSGCCSVVNNSITGEPSLLENNEESSSSPLLRDLVSNEFGLTLLAPLGDEQLWSLERSELYLSDESSPECTNTTTNSTSSSSNNNKRNNSVSMSMVTVTTQEHDDSSSSSEENKEEQVVVVVAGVDEQKKTTRIDDNDDDDDVNETTTDNNNPILLLPVLPEPADDLQFCPRILTPNMMQQIHAQLPEALQQNKWDRCFAIGRDGDSFVTLLECCKEYQFTVIVIRTLQGYVLGGFASQPWSGERHNSTGTKKSSSYYGTGQSFLFASHPDERLPGDAEPVVATPAAAASTTTTTANNHNANKTILEEEETLSFFNWTGTNDYCQICNVDKLFLCMGGEGAFGWIIQDNFERGQSGRCRTYSNPPLVPGDCFGGHFEIADFEIYGLQPLFSALSTSNSSSRSSRSWLSIRG